MTKRNLLTVALTVVLVATLAGGVWMTVSRLTRPQPTRLVGYFDNSNGVFVGDDVVILGVPVGKIDRITAGVHQVEIGFHVDAGHPIPADAKAVIIAPSLVTPRALQLTPVYTSGPVMHDGATIPRDRTAVPMEYDDVRAQLKKLVDTLQPTQPGGVSTLGAAINTAAANLRGEGSDIRQALIQLSTAFSALGDHSGDISGTVTNLAVLVSALHDSSEVLGHLNTNLAAVTGLLANDPAEISTAVDSLNTAATEVSQFLADNRDALGQSTAKLSAISQALGESLDDIKQALHVGPTAFSNVVNLYAPSLGGLTGVAALNNFANPLQFLCGAIQAASREGAEQSAKLCAQYLAPIVKNRQLNFPPLGENFFVGARARPNEITYSEDWLRPSYGPNAPAAQNGPAGSDGAGAPSPPAPAAPPYPAEATPTDPNAGLRGLMLPGGQP